MCTNLRKLKEMDSKEDTMLNETEQLKAELLQLRTELQQVKAERDKALKQLVENSEKTAKAEKASEMKSLFLANMSHELRTPLNAIEGFSRIMAETESAEERMKFYEIIETSNSHLQRLINEVLELSRVESGEITLKNTMVDIGVMGKGIVNLFEFRCPEQVKINWHGWDDKQVIMNTDQNRLIQVFSNLISNALKHTNKGSIDFGFHMQIGDPKIEFYCEDTGSGIAPEDISKIFGSYYSVDAQTKGNGFGLGLPLCKIIVEKMGGEIHVESTLGKGSKFTFTVPFEGSITDKTNFDHIAEATARTVIVTTRTRKGERKRILVAEDEDTNFELVKRILQNNYDIIRAKDGIEAVTLNEEEKPDMILMDIRMPNMGGLDATRIIKEVNNNVPVVALSAFAFPEYIEEAKKAGCDDFLAKPFKINDLNAIIDKYNQ